MKKSVAGIMMATMLTAGMLGVTAGASEDMALSLWHIWPEGTGGTEEAIKRAIASTEEHFPGLKIEVDAVADVGDSYKTKVRTAAAGGELPDVFFSWGGGFAETFVDAGRCLKMDDYLPDGTMDKVAGGTTDFFEYDGGIYGLPFGAKYGVLYCNKAMFEAAGLEIPTTFDELLNVVSEFSAQGQIPICLGAKGQDSTGWFVWQLAEREAGADYVNKVLAGEATFDTPELLKAGQDFKDLIDAGAFDPNAMALGKDEAQALFMEGLYPMYFCGSWFCGDVYNSETVKDDITCVSFPVIEGGKGTSTEFVGGADQAFLINSEVADPEKTVEVVCYLSEQFSMEQFKDGGGLATWKSDVDISGIDNQIFVQAYEVTSESTATNLWWDNFLTPEKATTQLEANTKLFMGEVTPEEWVQLNVECMQ